MLDIIADDLTGALDAAVAFACRGHPVAVAPSLETLGSALASGAAVVALNTDSRDLAPDRAAERIRQAVRILEARTPTGRAPPLLFKKIDSRLKGPAAAELAALIEISGAGRLLVSPTIPRLGRFVQHGHVVGLGVDPPLDVAALLPQGARLRVLVPDVASPGDLIEPVRKALKRKDRTLYVGAAGLAEALSDALPAGRPLDRPDVPGPVLMVVSSRDPITLRQVEALRRSRPDVQYIAAPGGRTDVKPHALVRTVLLHAVGEAGAAASRDIAEAAARTARDLATAMQARRIFACGGDTALAVVRAFDLSVLYPIEELLPGAPLCVTESPSGRLLFATKSGGFGAPDALLRIAEHLSP